MKRIIYNIYKGLKSRISTTALLLSAAGTIQAQSVSFGEAEYDLGEISNLKIEGQTQSFEVPYKISEIKEVTFSYKDFDFSKDDKKTSGNEIKSFSFKAINNNGTVLADVDGKISGDEISVFIPYYEGGSIKASFEATGTVFTDGKQQKSGVSGNVYKDENEYKVVDGSGNIHTYTVKVYNSGLPIIRIDGPADMASKMWNGLYPMTMTSAEGKKLAQTKAEIKPKGGQNSESKRDFNIKCDKKTEFGSMKKNKRWMLLSNADDASMLRTRSGFTLGKELDGMSWTPSSQFVEVVMGNKHLGTYLLCEQIRVSEARVKESAVWEITNEIESDDVWFTSDKGTKVRLVDSDEDDPSTELAKAKVAVNKLESALDEGTSFASYIDKNSFVDWIWANEICKNEKTFKKDTYFRITTDGKIAMSPIFSNEKWLGNNAQSSEGFSTITKGWCLMMMRDVDFSAAVCKRFKDIASTESIVRSAIEDDKDLISLSVESNDAIWGNKNVNENISSLTSWIKKRYAWLSSMNDVICMCSKADEVTSSNEITDFYLNKSSNESALDRDYTATITEDSITIFVPYLVNFDLKAEFSVSDSAKVYCNGKEIKSEESIVCYQKPQQFKVVSSKGDVHTYTVCIYNSGLPVIYLTTKDKASINDKVTWLDETEFTIYNADGTVDFDADPELVQVKGRGNSTWDCAPKDKRPYAVKLNKKSRVMGMAEHKRWCLLASYFDPTLIHNAMTNYLAKKYTNQDWVPSGYNCELVLNGKHKGVYYFCEQVKNSESRVNGEYLMESDTKKGFSSSSIKGPKSRNAFYTKDPELDPESDEFKNIKDIIEKFETALYGAEYDSLMEMIDLESFVDWYMIKELAHDVDGNMFTSCYFTIMKDGQMKMGPLWDFDLTYGTSPFDREFAGSLSYEGYYITTTNKNTPNASSWFREFIKMPAFQQILKEKVLNLEAHIDDIFDYIDAQTEYLKLSVTTNKNTYSTGSGTMKESDYIKKMTELKDFVQARLGWFVQAVSEF